MPQESRVSDITIGICDHGEDCCPHDIIGEHTQGSPDQVINNLSATRVGDIGMHNCPHCGINICMTGSPNKVINNIPTHRQYDIVDEIYGLGETVTGSPNSENSG